MNISDLAQEITSRIQGDVTADPDIRKTYSRDTSIFERMPQLVIFPKTADDVAAVVRSASEAKRAGIDVSITPRSAGTDMTGGPLTTSIALVFTKYMNRFLGIEGDDALAEPGLMYRDFEKRTLLETGRLLPSYPASRELCAIGGMVANNAGGELTLRYGKTNLYTHALDVVLADGTKTTLRPLSPQELALKKAQTDFEGSIYRRIAELIDSNRALIERARPHVSKNSAGYALWSVENPDRNTFDLTQLVTGSQGTLAIVTKAMLGLVKLPAHRSMLVVFLPDISHLPDVVARVLRCGPESFESYDDHTFKLAVRFFPQIVAHAGWKRLFGLAFSFTSEAWMVLTGGVPKLVLLAEFAEDTPEKAEAKAHAARAALEGLPVRTKIAESEAAAAKYWAIRRESFSLLRQNLKGLYASPFIDDLVINPDSYTDFLPRLQKLLDDYKLLYTIAGHIGDGNFHIIPLMDLNDPNERRRILELAPKVYELVGEFKGSITGEHNDGIIRTAYLPLMFEPAMIDLFKEVKRIFDPHNILNPGKKVDGTITDMQSSMITHKYV